MGKRKTADRERPQTKAEKAAATEAPTGLVVPQKNEFLIALARRYGSDPRSVYNTIKDTCLKPPAKGPAFTDFEMAAFFMLSSQYNLNPLLREIHAFRGKGGGLQCIVGIDGWMKIINSHEELDGIEAVETFDDKGALVSVTATIHRSDRKHPTVLTEYLAECKRDTEPWKTMPRRMLRHKALIQAARVAFGLGGIVDPDEAERVKDADVVGVTDTAPGSPGALPEPEPEAPATANGLNRPSRKRGNKGKASPESGSSSQTPASGSGGSPAAAESSENRKPRADGKLFDDSGLDDGSKAGAEKSEIDGSVL